MEQSVQLCDVSLYVEGEVNTSESEDAEFGQLDLEENHQELPMYRSKTKQ